MPRATSPSTATRATEPGYANGQFTQTPVTYHEAASSQVKISADSGGYPGHLTTRAYNLDLVDVTAPHQVNLDNRPLPQANPNSSSPGWWYDPATTTLHVRTQSLPTNDSHTITQAGGRPVDRAQSAAVDLSIDPATPITVAAGASATVHTTVTNAGPGASVGRRSR